MRKILAFILILFWSATCLGKAQETKSNTQLVKDSLNQFVISWNEGNIDDALEIYKKSSETQLISESVIKGYAQIVKFWKESYPEKEDMGTMTFSNIEVKQLSNRYAMAVGKWNLTNVKNQTGGIFTVLFEKTDRGEWKAVVDHTTGL